MPPASAKSPIRPEKGFLNRGVVIKALEHATPRVRLMFVIRCGMRIRGLMQHRLVAQGLDHMQSLGRRACLDPSIIDERFIAALKFLRDCVEDEEMPGIDDPDNKETSPYKVEAVAVARVYEEVRRWHDHEEDALWTAGLAAAESEDAIRLMRDVSEEEKGRLLDSNYRALMSDLEHAKSGKEPNTHEPSSDGPWGPLWLDGSPKWYAEAERTRPLTSIKDCHNEFLISKSHNKPTWRYLEEILKQMSQGEALRLPPRDEAAVEGLSREVDEFESFVRRVNQRIEADPAAAEFFLPALGVLAKAIEGSGRMMRTKEVAETLNISQGRVYQLAVLGRIVCTLVLGISTFTRTQIENLAKIERPPGRPRQQ